MDWQSIVAIIVWSFLVGPIQKWLKEKLNSTLWSWVFTIVIGIGGIWGFTELLRFITGQINRF